VGLGLYAITLFTSAFLLFCVQPLVGRMMLPLLGGTPAVWVTCMVFFQAALLAGYAWAHALARTLPPRRQALVHLAVLLGALALLPIDLGHVSLGSVPVEENPVPWLLSTLVVVVGLPFFALAASAPLLQRLVRAEWASGGARPVRPLRGEQRGLACWRSSGIRSCSSRGFASWSRRDGGRAGTSSSSC